MTAPISEDDLHAYADGRLTSERAVQVEAWLAAHPARRAEIEGWRAQSARLHRVFDPVLTEPLPVRLSSAATRRWFESRALAAGVALLAGSALGFAVGFRFAPAAPTASAHSLPRQAAVAHAVYTPEVRHPVEVGADQQAHLVAWLSKRLGAALRVPSLEEAGYRLVGGRLLPGDRGEVAQFMFENDAGVRLTLYVRPGPSGDDTAFRYARENNVDVFYWVDRRLGYALTGGTGREDMLRLAEIVYRQLGS